MAADEIRNLDEQLKTVQAAIQRILEEGASVQIQGRTYSEANINALERRELRLKRQLSRKARGGISSRRGVPLDG